MLHHVNLERCRIRPVLSRREVRSIGRRRKPKVTSFSEMLLHTGDGELQMLLDHELLFGEGTDSFGVLQILVGKQVIQSNNSQMKKAKTFLYVNLHLRGLRDLENI